MTAPEPKTIQLDPITLLVNASGPVKVTVGLLLLASTLVWVIAVLKWLQLTRLRAAEASFQKDAMRAATGAELFEIAGAHRAAPGGRVIAWLQMRGAPGSADRLRAIVDRAIVSERQRAATFLPILGTIAAVSPFVGLFGTVYGIIDAFLRIGAEKSASLPVVAPAIGEALIATAIGLAAAIPAVVFYNLIDKRLGDFESELEAAAAEWVLVVAESRSDSHERDVAWARR
jgi:biopolymer transport protein TolQ